MSEKILKSGIQREDGYLYFIDSTGNIARVTRGGSNPEIIQKCEFVKESGFLYYIDKEGDVCRSQGRSFKEFAEVRDGVLLGEEQWIQKATADIKRRGTEGVCTGEKFGGESCPPGSKRYNLAKTFKTMAHKKD